MVIRAAIYPLAAMFACSSVQAQADNYNVPNASGQQIVGRIKVFNSPRGVTWYLPTAFSSRLSCTTGGGATRICTVTIYNFLEETEKSDLATLQQTVGGKLSYFTSIEPFVSKVDEAMSVDLPNPTSQPLLLRTLQLNGPKIPYASLMQKMTNEQAADLLSKFSTTGIGEFNSKVTFRAERTNAYLKLLDTEAAVAAWKQSGAVNSSGFRSLIHDSLNSAKIISYGIDESTRLTFTEYYVRNQCFTVRSDGKYYADKPDSQCLPKNSIVLNETSEPFVTTCVAKLNIKQDAKVIVNCDGQP